MTDFENMEAVELSLEEMDQVAGGAFKRPDEKKGFQIYQIKKGENLTRIAKKFKTTVAQILKDNPKITNKSLIYAGDFIYIRK